MRALFLADKNVSHTHDTFYNALHKALGDQGVHDYPCFQKYHTNHKIPGDQYSWWCYTETKHILSLTLSGWASEINAGKIKWIFCSNRGDAPSHLFELIEMINEDMFKNICITFIEEEHDLDFGMHKENVRKLQKIWDKIDIYYRMDYIKSMVDPSEKIFPLYICAPQDKLLSELTCEIKPFEDREYDVCYVVGASHVNRKKYYDILKNNLKIGNNIIEYGDHKYGLSDYFNLINNSKIFISVRGNEYHNTRNIEGPYLGAALFSESLPTTIDNNYIDNDSCIYFDENTIINSLVTYLSDYNKLKTLASKSKQHCDLYHTDIARANQFFRLANRIKAWV